MQIKPRPQALQGAPTYNLTIATLMVVFLWGAGCGDSVLLLHSDSATSGRDAMPASQNTVADGRSPHRDSRSADGQDAFPDAPSGPADGGPADAPPTIPDSRPLDAPSTIPDSRPADSARDTTPPYLHPDAPSGPMLYPALYLPFTDGKTWDRSGQGNDAYVYRAEYTQRCPGLDRPCFEFGRSGSNRSIAPMEIPFRKSLTFGGSQDYSIALWARNDTPRSNGELLHAPARGSAYAYRLAARDDGSYRFCAYDGTLEACAAIRPVAPTEWNLVVGIKRGHQICIGLNADTPRCSSYALTSTTRATEGRVSIGQHPSGVNALRGALANIMLLDYALSSDEIKALHNDTARINTCEVGEGGCCGNNVCDRGESVSTCIADCATGYWEKRFMREYFQNEHLHAINHDLAGSVYFTNIRVRPLINMYNKTRNPFYLEKALERAEKSVSLMRDVDGDGKREWACMGTDTVYCFDHDATENTENPLIKYPLCAERAGREITAVAKLIATTPALSRYASRATVLRDQMEQHLVLNPNYAHRFACTCSGCDQCVDCCDQRPECLVCDFGNPPVHHIVAHQAVVLRNLYELTGNAVYKQWFTAKATSLKRATFPNPNQSQAVLWGAAHCVDMIYDYPRCYNGHDTIISQCTDSEGHSYCFPMDITHSAAYVDMVIQFHKAGYVFDRAYVDALSHTVRSVLLQQDGGQYYLRTHLDGRDQPPQTVPKLVAEDNSAMPTWMGRGLISPGWTSLAEFDQTLKRVYATMGDNTGDYRLRPTHMLNYLSDMAQFDAPVP